MESRNPGVDEWPKRTDTAKRAQLKSYWKVKNRNSGEDTPSPQKCVHKAASGVLKKKFTNFDLCITNQIVFSKGFESWPRRAVWEHSLSKSIFVPKRGFIHKDRRFDDKYIFISLD